MGQAESSGAAKITLEPGEGVIGQIKWFGADLVATNKRIFRIYGTSYEELDFKDISGIKIKSSTGMMIFKRIISVLLFIVLIGAIIVLWLGYADGDFSLMAVALGSIVLAGIAVFALWATFYLRLGYYRIESARITKKMTKYWSVGSPLTGVTKFTEFFQAISRYSGIAITRE